MTICFALLLMHIHILITLPTALPPMLLLLLRILPGDGVIVCCCGLFYEGFPLSVFMHITAMGLFRIYNV